MSEDMLAVAFAAATGMGCAVAGLIFLRHWAATRDRLFGWFSASFFLMALNRVGLLAVGEQHEVSTYIYLLRALAFALIIAGIVEKNLRPRP
jgi:hypothetical protein